MRKVVTMTVVGVAVLTGISGSANAGGWIADHVVGPLFGDHAAHEADKVHAQLGNPLDHAKNVAVGVAVDAVVPGAGPAATAALEAQSKK